MRVIVGVSEIVGVIVSVRVGKIAVGIGRVGLGVALISGFACSIVAEGADGVARPLIPSFTSSTIPPSR